MLQDAVFSDRRLRLRYRHGGDAEPRTCTVDPYGLVSKAGVWYLVADRRGAPRLFRADRVRSATLLPDPVRRRPGVELADAWEVLRRQVEERPGVSTSRFGYGAPASTCSYASTWPPSWSCPRTTAPVSG